MGNRKSAHVLCFPIPPIPHSSEWQSPRFLTRLFLSFYSLGLTKKGGVEQSGDVVDDTVVILFHGLRCTVATCTPLTPSLSPARTMARYICLHMHWQSPAVVVMGPLSSLPLPSSSSSRHLYLSLLLLLAMLFTEKKPPNVVVPHFKSILEVSNLSIFRHRPLLVSRFTPEAVHSPFLKTCLNPARGHTMLITLRGTASRLFD